jgi:hypothetical protein
MVLALHLYMRPGKFNNLRIGMPSLFYSLHVMNPDSNQGEPNDKHQYLHPLLLEILKIQVHFIFTTKMFFQILVWRPTPSLA